MVLKTHLVSEDSMTVVTVPPDIFFFHTRLPVRYSTDLTLDQTFVPFWILVSFETFCTKCMCVEEYAHGGDGVKMMVVLK